MHAQPVTQAAPEQHGKNKLPMLLVLLLVIATVEYSTFFYAKDALSQKDYAVIPDPRTRVSYCMINSFLAHEKAVLAESVVRPPEPELFARISLEMIKSAATPEKRAAIDALKKRDELRQSALNHVGRVAAVCGYDKVDWSSDASPWAMIERWLMRDHGFLFSVETARRSSPDAAAQLKKS